MQTSTIEPLFLSPREWTKRYGRGLTTLYKLINAGEITAKKDGPSTLISVASSDAWAARLPDFKSEAA